MKENYWAKFPNSKTTLKEIFARWRKYLKKEKELIKLLKKNKNSEKHLQNLADNFIDGGNYGFELFWSHYKKKLPNIDRSVCETKFRNGLERKLKELDEIINKRIDEWHNKIVHSKPKSTSRVEYTRLKRRMERYKKELKQEIDKLISNKSLNEFEEFAKVKGHEKVIKAALSKNKINSEGARFIIEYCGSRLKKSQVQSFERPLPINTKNNNILRTRDIVTSTHDIELKSWRKSTFESKKEELKQQFIYDVSTHINKKTEKVEGLKWVFDSRKISKEEVFEIFENMIKGEEFKLLTNYFGNGPTEVRSKLKDIIEMFP